MREAFAHLTEEDTTVERERARGQDALKWAVEVVEEVGLLKD